MSRTYRHITAAELQRWAQMRKEGASYPTIAKHAGRHAETVRRALRTYEKDTYVEQRHEQRDYLASMRKALILRNQQMSYPDIARTIHWHASTRGLRQAVRRYALREGLVLYRRAS